ncbi:hypothetical protein ACFHWD_03445 [Clostridium sp. MT-14]|uniref:hypothetical protein n=1 Tax=Clostridium sp. MT-14 TaxID=3348360 RepID=UPI0035F47C8C
MDNITKWRLEDKIKKYLINRVKNGASQEQIKIVDVDMTNPNIEVVINELCQLDYIKLIKGGSSEKIITKDFYDYIKKRMDGGEYQMNMTVININNKRLLNWKSTQVVQKINEEQIVIVEELHIKGKGHISLTKVIEKFKDKDIIDKRIVIRPINNDKYALVMGLKWLLLARELKKPLTCIIVDTSYTHRKLVKEIGLLGYYFKVPNNTEDILNLRDIHISKSFKNTKPQKYKINKYRNYFNEHKCLDKPVVVQKKNVDGKEYMLLTDGYIRYLIFKKKGIVNIPVRYAKESGNNAVKIS